MGPSFVIINKQTKKTTLAPNIIYKFESTYLFFRPPINKEIKTETGNSVNGDFINQSFKASEECVHY